MTKTGDDSGDEMKIPSSKAGVSKKKAVSKVNHMPIAETKLDLATSSVPNVQLVKKPISIAPSFLNGNYNIQTALYIIHVLSLKGVKKMLTNSREKDSPLVVRAWCCKSPDVTDEDYLLSSTYFSIDAKFAHTCTAHHFKFSKSLIEGFFNNRRVEPISIDKSKVDIKEVIFAVRHVDSDYSLTVEELLDSIPPPKTEKMTIKGTAYQGVNPIFFMPYHHKCGKHNTNGNLNYNVDKNTKSFGMVNSYCVCACSMSKGAKSGFFCSNIPSNEIEQGVGSNHMNITVAWQRYYLMSNQNTAGINEQVNEEYTMDSEITC